jgi:Rho GTPase-activating protein RGD1
VATLLKHFLRDLPDSLFTAGNYGRFIQAAKLDNEDIRRDSLHAVINELPDPNYATLRVLTLHLFRVSRHAEKNRMTTENLAICLGPTLMGQQGNGANAAPNSNNLADAGWQAKCVETILNHTYEIFDDD